MGRFRIFETDQFLEELSADFKGHREKIRGKLIHYVYPQLRENPFFGKNIKKLKNYEPDTWRYRIGDYRFFYGIDEKDSMVYMITVEARKDSY